MGYQHSRLNALSHGLTARTMLLPWEDAAAFQTLLDALLAEHRPMGPTEHHLVQQLAALFWRQQRLLHAEAASIQDSLREQLSFDHADQVGAGAMAHLRPDEDGNDVLEAVQASEQDNHQMLAALDGEETRLQRTLRILRRGGQRVYERALAALPENIQAAWQQELEDAAEQNDDEGQETMDASPMSLRQFLEAVVLPQLTRRRQAIHHRPQLRDHAIGLAIARTDLERLARYETHLTRQIQRMLAMLLRLQEARTTIAMPAA
jgi:hypothetical protein